MARKTKVQLAGEAALVNLHTIHALACEAPDGRSAVYTRNAGDCTRWCKAVRDAGLPFPAWMYAGGIRWFAAIWNFTP